MYYCQVFNTKYKDINTHTHKEKIMSNGKSGFEIRADLLNQAQGILEGNIYRNNEAVVEHNNNFPNDRKPYGDQFVSTEEVISVARQLNEFVNEK